MSLKILHLKKVVDECISQNESWEYICDPNIRKIIDDFNEYESDIFSSDILTWDEYQIFHLADNIIFGNNPFLDKSYLYCLILSKTTNRENGEYLLENFTAIFTDLDAKKCSAEFLVALKEKVQHFSKVEIDENHIFAKLFAQKMKSVNE